MNERQTELIRKLLVNTHDVSHVQALADELGCSEKTLRNDLHAVEEHLHDQSSISLIRKPGVGVYLSGPEEEISAVFHGLYQKETKSDEDRMLEVAYRLLAEEGSMTLKKMAGEYFTSKPIIRKDLEEIHRWLVNYDLQLVSKQRIGSMVVGDELDKRNALAHLPELITSRGNTHDHVLRLFPQYEVNLIKQTLRQMIETFSMKFAGGELDSLLIHALVMVKRTRQRCTISMKKSDEQFVVETEEYARSEWFFHRLSEGLRIRFPIEERVYFTWHLISCKRPDGLPKSHQSFDEMLNRVIDQLTFQLQIMTMIDFRNDSKLMDGLRIHLGSTLHRVQYGLTIRNPMVKEIKKMYPYMFSMVVLAVEEVTVKHKFDIPEDEAAYLVLHFQASIERLEKRRDTSKRVLIVCELGVGMSHLLQAKLAQTYKGLVIVDCVGERDVASRLAIDSIDFIISTKSLEAVDIPVIVISPLLEAKDKKRLDQFLQKIESEAAQGMDTEALLDLFHEDFIYKDVQLDHPYKVIEMLADDLTHQGIVNPTFAQRALAREQSSATAIGGSIAIPHAHPEEVNRSVVSIAILDRPIEWGKEQVSVVFLLAIAEEDQQMTRPLMQKISNISDHPDLIERLIQASDSSEIKQVLTQ